MTDFTINGYILNKECETLAKEIFEEIMSESDAGETPEDKRDDMTDRAHEYADGHQWVIYTHKALMLCAHCSTDYGDDFLSDVGFEWTDESTIYTVATTIAYGEMRGRIEFHLSELIEESEG